MRRQEVSLDAAIAHLTLDAIAYGQGTVPLAEVEDAEQRLREAFADVRELPEELKR